MRSAKTRTARRYRISGRVQGVGFRYFAERAAHSIGVSGYVRNCADGSVEVYAIGEVSALEVLRNRLTEGPRSARVEEVEETEVPVEERYKKFSIEGGW